MKYVMLMMGDLEKARCGDDSLPSEQEFMDYDADLQKAGVLVDGGFALHDPEIGVSVTIPKGATEAVVTTGPYAESREYVGGSFIIDVPDIDAAIEWAKKCPGAKDSRVEIRAMADY